jgi:hypothetical protein
MSRHILHCCLGIMGLFLACGSALSACQSLPQAPAAITDGPATIAGIVQQPAQYLGRQVTLNATFAGWQGNCRGPVPATRSDWMLEDGGACLYVTGPMPDGFSAAAPKQGIGGKVTVTGAIELTQDGRAYLHLPR